MEVFATCIDARLRYLTPGGTFVDCPGGTHATGGGASTTTEPASAWLNALYPFADPANPPDDGFLAVLNDSGTSIAYAICK